MEDMGPHNSNPARDIRIAIAGPLVNLVIAAISGVFILAFLPQARSFGRGPSSMPRNLPRALFWSNVFLGAFNLLPAYPMDGGRVLRAYLSRAHGICSRYPHCGHRRAGLCHAAYLPRASGMHG